MIMRTRISNSTYKIRPNFGSLRRIHTAKHVTCRVCCFVLRFAFMESTARRSGRRPGRPLWSCVFGGLGAQERLRKGRNGTRKRLPWQTKNFNGPNVLVRPRLLIVNAIAMFVTQVG
jgi:hypothetical protein